MDAIETWKTAGGCTVSVYWDDCAENPREWGGNVGKLVSPREKYFKNEVPINSNIYGEYWLDAKEYAAVFPLYVLDHSGVNFSIGYAANPWGHWDCFQCGWIVVEKDEMRARGWKRLSKKRRDQLREWIAGELETYSDYCNGAVYYYTVTDPDGNEVDACGGYYGYNGIEEIKAQYPET